MHTRILILISAFYAAGLVRTSPVSASEEIPSFFTGSLNTSFGKALAPEDPATSFSLEPILTLKPWGETWQFQATTFVDRPTNLYRKISVPYATLRANYTTSISSELSGDIDCTFTGLASFLDLERWNLDGPMVRTAGLLSLNKEFTSWWTLSAQIGPQYQFNRYRLRANAETLPSWGFLQKITSTFTPAYLNIELTLVTEQLYRSRWQNDFSTYEHIAFQTDPAWMVGISHQLLSSAVDPSTGRFRSFSLVDERESRLSAFFWIEI